MTFVYKGLFFIELCSLDSQWSMVILEVKDVIIVIILHTYTYVMVIYPRSFVLIITNLMEDNKGGITITTPPTGSGSVTPNPENSSLGSQRSNVNYIRAPGDIMME